MPVMGWLEVVYGVPPNHKISKCYFIFQSTVCTNTVNMKALPLSSACLFSLMNNIIDFQNGQGKSFNKS